MIGGKNWVFIENPKTATTSMRQPLLELGAESMYGKHVNLADLKMTHYHTRYRFVVVRNPYDRIVSAWQHATNTSKGEKGRPFEDWLTGEPWTAHGGLDIKRAAQSTWAWQCNQILRFENLEEDWRRMLDTIGFPYRPLEKRNTQYRKVGHYHEVFTPRTREIVADRFKADLDAWGYSY